MLPVYRPVTSWVHYTTSCNTQSSAPEDGRNYRPKHAELIGIINKPLLFHLVGCLYYLYQWCTVNETPSSFRFIVAMFVWNCELQLVFVVKYELDYEDLIVIPSQNRNIVQLCTHISESCVLKPCNLRKWTRDIIRLLEFPSPRRNVTCVCSLFTFVSP